MEGTIHIKNKQEQEYWMDDPLDVVNAKPDFIGLWIEPKQIKGTMISAVYSSKELSLALQKKGIEAHCVKHFEKGGGWYYRYTFDIICRWLREVHGLHIYTFRLGEKWHYEIQVFKEGYTYSKVGGDSHDEAVEKAIWKCINELI
jgi:hypothetical protein